MALKSLKSIDFKAFFLRYGELVGLGVAGVVMLGMLVLGGSLLAGSFKSNADELAKKAELAQQQIRSSAPSPTEEAEMKVIPPALKPEGAIGHVSADPYRPLVTLFAETAPPDDKRRGVHVKLPSEFQSAIALVQAKVYKLNQDRSRIWVLEGGGANGPMGGGNLAALGQFYNRTRQQGGPPKMPGGMAPSTAGGGAAGGGEGGDKPKLKVISVEDLEKVQDVHPAEDILPMRVAEVVASFPWKEQLEEFKQALRYRNLEDLASDPEARPQFLGFEVERAEIKPGSAEEKWQPLDVDRNLKPIVLLAGRRFEPDDPALDAVSFDGLVMQRPLQMRPGQYPTIEKELKLLGTTLATLKNAQESQIVKPANRFITGDDLDIYQKKPAGSEGGPGGPMGPGGAMPGPMGGSSGPSSGPGSGGAVRRPPASLPPMGMNPMGGGFAEQNAVIPEYCLLRFLDVDVQPGKTYKYRFRIKMKNPNYKRADVAWASLAADPEIKSDLVTVPQALTVPTELYYYAVDMKAKAPREFYGAQPAGPNQVAIQAQRWLDYVKPDPRNTTLAYAVADWVVAERQLVTRGEYMGREGLVEVPIWDVLQERFALASPAGRPARNKKEKVPVLFGPENTTSDALLVDYQGGPDIGYNRVVGVTDDDKPKVQRVSDKAPVELIMLSPDGTLQSRDAIRDFDDPVRTERVETYKARIKEIQDQDKPKESGGKFGG